MDGFLEDHFHRLVVRYDGKRCPVQVVVESLYPTDNCYAFSFQVTVVRLCFTDKCHRCANLDQHSAQTFHRGINLKDCIAAWIIVLEANVACDKFLSFSNALWWYSIHSNGVSFFTRSRRIAV